MFEIIFSDRSRSPRFPFTGTPGVSSRININYISSYILEKFLDYCLLNIIVKETKNSEEQRRSENRTNIPRFFHNKKCISTNDREMKLFLGLLILQGIVWKPNQAMYWSHRKFLHTPVYSKLMSVNRFILLFRYLYFCNNEPEKSFKNWKFWKIHKLIQIYIKKFVTFKYPKDL